ncbi:APC family permease [Sphingomonas gilva]|uniref:APC family permease n=1 Tax=Sphingomonas gilva TaxID=2305907 RepID=UPI001FEC26C8|nr:APC family permease [Sphingomonas gilva]
MRVRSDPPHGDIFADGAGPRPILGARHAVAICIGIVIGAGVFRTPSLVAANSADAFVFAAAWIAGGLLSIVGALCYAELASAYPGVGGDYSYLKRAFGARVGFIYAWARLSVIQTGSIALLAFVFGDYLAEIVDIGPRGPVLFAAAIVILLTALNRAGARQGAGAQLWLMLLEVGGLLLITAAAFLLVPPAPASAVAAAPEGSALGLVMVFVLLTFGGWSETVYVTAELRGGRRRIAGVLVASLALVTLLYLLVNLAFLHALGLGGMAASDAVAADAMRLAMGDAGAVAISLIVAVAALSSANATVITGARTGHALGENTPALGWLGRWDGARGTPGNALLAQGAVALLLVVLGGLSRDGFAAAVEFTAPVFWLAMFGVGVALFVLRRREPGVDRPFRVPLYPLTPAIFCATSLYLLWSSIAYTGVSALAGVALLAVGAALSLFIRLSPNGSPSEKEFAR